MSKAYRDRTRKRYGAQTVHKWRGVHTMDDAVTLEQLREEVRI